MALGGVSALGEPADCGDFCLEGVPTLVGAAALGAAAGVVYLLVTDPPDSVVVYAGPVDRYLSVD